MIELHARLPSMHRQLRRISGRTVKTAPREQPPVWFPSVGAELCQPGNRKVPSSPERVTFGQTARFGVNCDGENIVFT